MEIKDIMSCYCKARETQTFYTNCLNLDNLTDLERELIYDLIKHASHSSSLIKQYCFIRSSKEKQD